MNSLFWSGMQCLVAVRLIGNVSLHVSYKTRPDKQHGKHRATVYTVYRQGFT